MQIEQDMLEIFRGEDTSSLKAQFKGNWENYVVAILTFSETCLHLKSRKLLDPVGMYVYIYSTCNYSLEVIPFAIMQWVITHLNSYWTINNN